MEHSSGSFRFFGLSQLSNLAFLISQRLTAALPSHRNATTSNLAVSSIPSVSDPARETFAARRSSRRSLQQQYGLNARRSPSSKASWWRSSHLRENSSARATACPAARY